MLLSINLLKCLFIINAGCLTCVLWALSVYSGAGWVSGGDVMEDISKLGQFILEYWPPSFLPTSRFSKSLGFRMVLGFLSHSPEHSSLECSPGCAGVFSVPFILLPLTRATGLRPEGALTLIIPFHERKWPYFYWVQILSPSLLFPGIVILYD